MHARTPLRLILLAAAVALGSVGCDESTPLSPPPAEAGDLEPLVGDWTATSALYVSDRGERLEVVGEGGEVLITIRSGGLTTTRITLGDQVDEWHAFWWMGVRKTIRTAPLDSWGRTGMTLHYHLDGDELTLATERTDFVFTATDGWPEPATMRMVLQRR